MKLSIRVDAGKKRGLGHAMRCLALVQEAHERGIAVQIITTSMPDSVRRFFIQEKAEVTDIKVKSGSHEDAIYTAVECEKFKSDWLVIDGYQFDAEYQRELWKQAVSVLLMDDYCHLDRYYADIILNSNPDFNSNIYQVYPGSSRFLLGPRYALLRREFWETKSKKQLFSSQNIDLLIMIGGEDPCNITAKVLDSFDNESFEEVKITVVLGALNRYASEIEQISKKLDFEVEIKKDVRNISEIMRKMDIAITSASSTCWELASIGVPMIVGYYVANQVGMVKCLKDRKAAMSLGSFKKVEKKEIRCTVKSIMKDKHLARQLAANAANLVDGRGAERVINVLDSEQIILRSAQSDDCELLWRWANAPEVREMSFSSEKISLSEHKEWLKQKLENKYSFIYIACDSDGKPVGQIRFDIEGQEALVGVSVDPSERGKGYGTAIIRQGTKKIIKSSNVNSIHAWIKSNNRGSQKAFENCGYKKIETRKHRGHVARHYVANVYKDRM